jgi:hypothetical protein
MLLLLVLGPILLPEYRDPGAGRPDIVSAILSLSAVLAVIFGLQQIAQDGLGWLSAFMVLAGLVLGGLLIRRQRLLTDPLIDLRLFRVPTFAAALSLYGLGIFVMFGGYLFEPQYLQLVLGLSPLEAKASAHGSDHRPPASTASPESTSSCVSPRNPMLPKISPTRRGVSIEPTTMVESRRGVPPDVMAVARGTLGGAAAVAGQLPGDIGAQIMAAARGAFTYGLQLTAAISAVGSLALALFAAIALRGARSGGGAEEHVERRRPRRP